MGSIFSASEKSMIAILKFLVARWTSPLLNNNSALSESIARAFSKADSAVSYTHLTLPTKLLV